MASTATNRPAKRAVAVKAKKRSHKSFSYGVPEVRSYFGIGVPAPLKGARAKKAVQEAGLVTPSGSLKTRFR